MLFHQHFCEILNFKNVEVNRYALAKPVLKGSFKLLRRTQKWPNEGKV